MIKNITTLPEWHALKQHQEAIASTPIQTWFRDNPLRYQQFSLNVGGLLFDYSKNHLNADTITLFTALAHAAGVQHHIQDLFSGVAVNRSENRPALHTALRNPIDNPFYVKGENITPLITDSLIQMTHFSEAVRSGEWRGCTGQPIRDIINIGIGGSHLGPLFVTQALQAYAEPTLRCHFISNIDPLHLQDVLQDIHPETSLFIISSKSFTTLETLTNAATIKDWFYSRIPQSCATTAFAKHFIAVTAAKEAAMAFGIAPATIFPLWDWVGGRYSVWSAIGLPIALSIGMKHFLAFLAGAHEMDTHFMTADFSQNMPVLLALIGIWYINFFNATSHAIVPYSHPLSHLRTYLQQVDMESNGKSTSSTGTPIDYATGPIIWGDQGCNAQHAFHQLLHQGQHFIPVDFILSGSDSKAYSHHHDILIASGLSQAQALMQGKSLQQAFDELCAQGYSASDAQLLAQHKTIAGNRPSNIIFLEKITPKHVGSLLALYEHKIFVQGVIWQINSFDQWGVELGKQLLPPILSDLLQPSSLLSHDSSTRGLIQHYKKLRSVVCSGSE